MTNKICGSLLALLLFASVCFAAAKPITDDTIADQVMLKLSGDAVAKGGGFKVDCKNGVVTLSGIAENSRQRDRAATVAKKVKGVKSVVNNLTLSERGK